MPDLQETPQPPDLRAELGRSLSTVWSRYAGARPESSKTEVEGDVVRWILADGAGELKKGMDAAALPVEGEAPGPTRTVAGYKREMSVAVTRATHRRVVALIRKDDEKTGVASETFILERMRAKQ